MMASLRWMVVAAAAAVLAVAPGAGAAPGAETVKKAWLGVMLGPTDKGVAIVEVVPGSAADKAGLEEGDAILAVDGRAVEEPGDVTAAVREKEPGDTVRLEIEHDGGKREVTVKLGERSARALSLERGAGPHRWVEVFELARPRVRLGLVLQDLSEGLRGYFRVPAGQGVLVSEVAAGSPAAAAGLKAGDVILSVAGKTVASAGDLREEVAKLEPGTRVRLGILRDGAEQTVEVQAEARKQADDCPKDCPEACRKCCPGFGHGLVLPFFEAHGLGSGGAVEVLPEDFGDRLREEIETALEDGKVIKKRIRERVRSAIRGGDEI